MGDGHCGLTRAELTALAEKLLKVPQGLIESTIGDELAESSVTADRVGEAGCIFLTGPYQAERAIAGHLLRLSAGPLPWPEIGADRALPWIEARTGLSLAASQVEAIRLALRSKVTVITSGPDVGKTRIVNAILRILGAMGVKLLLAAPTGRAAKRMTETIGLEARTIHRLLEFDPKAFSFKRNEESPLDCDLLVVDESSMVDVPLMQLLVKALPPSAALLMVGDIDQLPSVGPGQVLADIIGSGAVPVVRLSEVFRQAAQSKIITTAHAINAGRLPDLAPPEGEADFYSCLPGIRKRRWGALWNWSADAFPAASVLIRSRTFRSCVP
jgi:exodeoxyribonuclease V alpha subunit